MADDAEAMNRAARYRAGIDRELEAEPDEESSAPARQRRPEDHARWVDQQIRAAIDRGEFDDLPYAGKPLPHIDSASQPDWWLQQLIERERITGVLPDALQLRKDDALLDGELDQLARDGDVRERLKDFNRRVVAARRQLQGGPPVVTPLRDVEADVAAWRSRRAQRARNQVRTSSDSPPRPRRWWQRRPR